MSLYIQAVHYHDLAVRDNTRHTGKSASDHNDWRIAQSGESIQDVVGNRDVLLSNDVALRKCMAINALPNMPTRLKQYYATLTRPIFRTTFRRSDPSTPFPPAHVVFSRYPYPLLHPSDNFSCLDISPSSQYITHMSETGQKICRMCSKPHSGRFYDCYACLKRASRARNVGARGCLICGGVVGYKGTVCRRCFWTAFHEAKNAIASKRANNRQQGGEMVIPLRYMAKEEYV